METATSQSSEITLPALFRFDASENGNTIGGVENLRPPLLRRLSNRRSASRRQHALLRALHFDRAWMS
jgi:hypothetical protein